MIGIKPERNGLGDLKAAGKQSRADQQHTSKSDLEGD